MLIVLLILSVITTTALPQISKQRLRQKEQQLKSDLIAVRAGIDELHIDWKRGVFAPQTTGISVDGYPQNWDILIDGVPTNDGKKRRYLRQIPHNPFAKDPEEPWLLLGFLDAADATVWNGVDIFDLRANSDHIALDGSAVRDW